MKLPIYLDYSSTTPIGKEVLDAMMPFLTFSFGNPSSRLNYHGMLASIAVEKARASIASLINAEKEEIIFTSGATESNNLAIKGLVRSLSDKKNHIITTSIEHSSVLAVCKYLNKIGYELSFIKACKSGNINIEDLENIITNKTALISIMHVNNETGVILPIKKIASIARKYGIAFHSDCTQSIDKLKIDVKKDGIDLLSFSGHKIYGPRGCGVLYVNSKYLNKMHPLMQGGGQEYSLRPGTLNTPAIIGISKAIEYIGANNNQRILSLRNKFEKMLSDSLDISVNACQEARFANISNIIFKNIEAKKLILKLQSKIACSTASACLNEKDSLSHVLTNMGLDTKDIESAIRFSLGKYTTQEEIDYAANTIIASAKSLIANK